ncbi:MAG TPA: DUF1801 domain-containing protein [Salinimicrobium sp.]|nr:DUF1801 domain-containing protein [Salinimicrobium sp.]
MQSSTTTPSDYLESLPEERKEVMKRLHSVITKNLPEGFKTGMGYGMIGYVVPFSLYPSGYHCDAEQPLPFMSLASQKNHIGLYHMGIYSDPTLLEWFVAEFPKHAKRKLDMGKSCIRFKKMDDIPYDLIAELSGKMTPQQWIDIYEKIVKR